MAITTTPSNTDVESADIFVFAEAAPTPIPAKGLTFIPPTKRKKTYIIVAIAMLLVVFIFCLGLGFGLRARSSATVVADDATSSFGNNKGDTADEEPFQGGDGSFISVGCFEEQPSLNSHSLFASNTNGRAIECNQRCLTRYFGVVGSSCRCFVSAPTARLSLGSCNNAHSASDMDVYFDLDMDPQCSQQQTETVRNFLVEEDDAPFGFDIVSNTFRSSPFELFKDECGTNMYEVQTEVSTGSSSLRTTVSDVVSFAESRRDERQRSLSTSASASYRNFLFSASVKVSASLDRQQTDLFESSGAQEEDSKVFIATGVQRLAEVKLVDFDFSFNFVTLSRPFGNLLRAYFNSNFDEEIAYNIIERYGEFVLTRGIFGGYMELRTTMSGSALEGRFNSESDAALCYEASVSAEAKGFGFSGKGSVGTSGCTEESVQILRESRQQFGTEVSEQTVVGGRKQCPTCDGFVVEASDSTLLTTKDKYPPNDDGAKFRLLSDFLDPSKISPLEFQRLQLTEDQFASIQSSLEDHILQYLNSVGDSFGSCDCGSDGYPYLVENESGERDCRCYSRRSPIRPTPVPAPTSNFVLPPMRHVPNTYCEYYDYGGDGPCSVGKSFEDVWQDCNDAGPNKCQGVLWNSCSGATSNTAVNGAWKLLESGQDIGTADRPTSTCGGRNQALGHWDAFARVERVPNAYCQYYKQGGDGDCSAGRSFFDVWKECDADGPDKCGGVMWNACSGPTSNTNVNGAWKLMTAGQTIGNAENPSDSCFDGKGHWDVFLR